MSIKSLHNEIANVFSSHGIPQDALLMKAYMKNKFEFFGIKSPLRSQLSAPFLKIKMKDENELFELVDLLWREDRRELQYLALEFLHRNRKLLTLNSLPIIELWVTTKSWWDTVDNLASKVIGLLLLRFPMEMDSIITPWIYSENMWLNRTAIIFQLKYKEEVNKEILVSAIERHENSTEFFIEKAIGWALRQYSKFDPEWVSAFIAAHQLRPLSIREGSKYL